MSIGNVADLALVVRVSIVGGLLLLLPRATRKGLLFGCYVGETASDSAAARRLRTRWTASCIAVMMLSWAVGMTISSRGQPVAGSLIGTAVLLALAFALYCGFHSRARLLAETAAVDRASKAVGIIGAPDPVKPRRFAALSLVVCLVASLGVMTYALAETTQAGITRLTAKVLFLPAMNLTFGPLFCVAALLVLKAKRSLRQGGPESRSVEAQEAFRAAMADLYSLMGLLICASLTLLSVLATRELIHGDSSLVIPAAVFGLLALGWCVRNVVRVLRRYGQGGARLERATSATPLTNGIADDSRWIWGLFYVDRDDPSLLVESRFGVGYDFNYGNRKALLMAAGLLILVFGFTAWGVLLARS